jgi:urease accessory protein
MPQDPMVVTDATVMMLLTDGRFPSGGHAYSAGMEQAVTWGDVNDLRTAEAFASGRASAAAIMAAQVVAVAHGSGTGDRPVGSVRRELDRLDEETDARTASGAAREISRQQGRRWLRAAQGTWPDRLSGQEAGTDAAFGLLGRNGWVVIGAASALLGLGGEDAATVALYELVGTPVWAAVRLLGLDPMKAAAVVARLVTGFEQDVRRAAREAQRISASVGTGETPSDLSWISWSTAPLSDLASEAHLRREERLFAS